MSLARDKALWSLLCDLGYALPEPGVAEFDEHDVKAFETALLLALKELLAVRRETIDAGTMTLAQIEALAARLDGAAKVFRDARALLGGSPASAGAGQSIVAGPHLTGDDAEPAPSEDAAAAHRRRQFQPPENPGGKHPHLSAAEVQQRNALLGRARDPGMDEDIARAMESE